MQISTVQTINAINKIYEAVFLKKCQKCLGHLLVLKSALVHTLTVVAPFYSPCLECLQWARWNEAPSKPIALPPLAIPPTRGEKIGWQWTHNKNNKEKLRLTEDKEKVIKANINTCIINRPTIRQQQRKISFYLETSWQARKHLA